MCTSAVPSSRPASSKRSSGSPTEWRRESRDCPSPAGCCRDSLRPYLDARTSYLDEALMYALAAVGIYAQVFNGFAIFFFLSIN